MPYYVSLKVEDDGRFSKLPDDILLRILEKSNIHTCIRASCLSTRWRHLPSLLHHISLDIVDFMHSNSTSVDHVAIEEAMADIAKAARRCLAAPGRESVMKTLSLRLLLTANYLYDIGKIVCKAIDNGEVKSVELALPTEKLSVDCDAVDMVRHEKDLVCFFNAAPNLFQCVTSLFLHSARFDELQLHRLLNSCEQLQHLVLNKCDTGDRSVLKIDLPKSKISYLRLRTCCFEKVEFLCLPKLTELHYESWFSSDVSSFGIVPCLEEVRLVCAAVKYQSGYNLSELLHGTREIHALTLDFQGEKIWMLPEVKKLYTLFNRSSKMFIHGIYVKFGLLWTKTLIDAAPSLKTFGIKVWDHVCDADSVITRSVYSKRTNPWRNNNELNSSRHLHLTRLAFGGFMATKKHVQLIRTIMDYAPSLDTILLEDKDPCETCDAVNSNLNCSWTSSMFPKSESEQDMVLTKLGVGLSCSPQIIFK